MGSPHVDWLREEGYDVKRTSEVGLGGAPDSALIRWSQSEDRIVLTLDEDFIGLYRHTRKPFGVIVIRTSSPTPNRIRELLAILFSNIKIERYSKELLVVTDREIRIESH